MNDLQLYNSAAVFSDLLKNKGLSLKLAESFTGGFITALLVQTEGASSFLSEGIVCYSNDSKIQRLNVSASIIDDFGAVSFACVKQMLDGLESDIAIATSGNAGPTAVDNKVGTCFVGVKYNQKIVVRQLSLNGSRSEIINKGAYYAINLAISLLKN